MPRIAGVTEEESKHTALSLEGVWYLEFLCDILFTTH